MEPIDIDEISKISNAVIDRIKSYDLEQYEALVESIQERIAGFFNQFFHPIIFKSYKSLN